MKKDEILILLSEIVAKETGHSSSLVTLNTVASDIDGWDSLAHARIIFALEKKLSIRIPDDKVFDLENVSELVQVILALE